MPTLAIALLRCAAELMLLPVRLVAILFGWVAVVAGMIGAPLWLIQSVIALAGGGAGDGPLSPGLMFVATLAASAVGCLLVTVAMAPASALSAVDEHGTTLQPGGVKPELGAQAGSALAQVPQARLGVAGGGFRHVRLRRASEEAFRRRFRRRPL